MSAYKLKLQANPNPKLEIEKCAASDREKYEICSAFTGAAFTETSQHRQRHLTSFHTSQHLQSEDKIHPALMFTLGLKLCV